MMACSVPCAVEANAHWHIDVSPCHMWRRAGEKYAAVLGQAENA